VLVQGAAEKERSFAQLETYVIKRLGRESFLETENLWLMGIRCVA
jgi:hypothetical protein